MLTLMKIWCCIGKMGMNLWKRMRKFLCLNSWYRNSTLHQDWLSTVVQVLGFSGLRLLLKLMLCCLLAREFWILPCLFWKISFFFLCPSETKDFASLRLPFVLFSMILTSLLSQRLVQSSLHKLHFTPTYLLLPAPNLLPCHSDGHVVLGVFLDRSQGSSCQSLFGWEQSQRGTVVWNSSNVKMLAGKGTVHFGGQSFWGNKCLLSDN